VASIQIRRRTVAPSAPTGAPAGTSTRVTVAVLAFVGMCGAFMQTLIIPMQGELPELLHAPRSATAWVVTATLLTAAAITPVAGRLGDLYGKREVILGLVAALIVGSVVCALSDDLLPLVIGRALQGAVIGVVPLGIALLRDLLPPDRLAGAVALVSATLGVGASLGLPISAAVSHNFDWHLVFWLAALLAVISFALVATLVPGSSLRTPGRFDPIGAVGLAIGLSAVLLAISQGANWGWVSAATLLTGVGGLVVLVGWGAYELRRASPLVDLAVAARRPVMMTNLTSVALGFALFSTSVAFPQLLQLPAETGVGFGLSLISASLIMMPAGLIMMAMSPIAARLTHTIGARVLLIIATATLAVAYLLVILLPNSVGTLLTANLVIGVGIGLGYAAMPTLIMHAVPATETAAANSLNTLMRMLGTSVAAAVVGAELAANSVPFGATTVPTTTGFHVAFITGGVMAVLGTAMAIAIPRRRAHFDREPALPEDVD
jgi:MFS family permease